MSDERSLQELQKGWPQTLKLYAIGFFGSLFLTGLSFSLAIEQFFSKKVLIIVLVFLALVQAFVQLLFFMHFGKEEKPRWMTLIFSFMALVLLIVVLGSLWIIFDLNNRVMPKM